MLYTEYDCSMLELTHSLNFADNTCPKKTLIGVSESYISESPMSREFYNQSPINLTGES